MKLIAGFLVSMLGIFAIISCNSNSSSSANADSTATTKDTVATTASAGSTAGFKLGVQMWTFRMFSVADALSKVDSAGIKHIEAFWGQKLGGDMKGEFGIKMSAEDKEKLKKLLQSKGIDIVAMGVISPGTKEEWVKAFELAKEFGLKYITAEPKKEFWNLIDSLGGAAGIKIAIHDHPKPNAYQHPDSVLAAIQGHKNIGACADIGHWARNGLDPVECLKKLEGHVYGAHLKDIVKFDDPKAADTVVSKGVINIPAALAEFKRQNFDGMFSIEHESNWYNNLPDVIFTREYFEAQVAKLNK
ncbi:MAG: sugar phosphate isomerase/epimerase [Chitinophagaceae bacterium]|nr:sugar phosphate isomerase/epimerase [Chitinophagaceae bacterium]